MNHRNSHKTRFAKHRRQGGNKILRKNSRASRQTPRRGILLLVVLTMLTLFLLIGTTYLVSANYFRKANKSFAAATQAEYLSVDQGTLLDEALRQLIRDTDNESSSLRYHSLLRDMYGNDGVKIGPNDGTDFQLVNRQSLAFAYENELGNDGTVDSDSLDTAMENTGNQFFWIAAIVDLGKIDTPFPSLNEKDHYYNGRVLTVLDGDLAGTSARIIDYDYFVGINSSNGFALAVFTLLPLNAEQQVFSRALTDNNVVGPSHSIIINGQPYNGTGVGFNRLDSYWARHGSIE